MSRRHIASFVPGVFLSAAAGAAAVLTCPDLAPLRHSVEALGRFQAKRHRDAPLRQAPVP